jgi:penicillin-binding protein 1C
VLSIADEQVIRPRPRRNWVKWAGALAYAGGAVAMAGLIGAHVLIRDITPTLPPTPDVATMPVSTVIVDRHGELLRPYTTADGMWRLPVALDDVDRRFIAMLIAYEDRHFEDHHGIDWSGLLRAAGQFVLAGGHIVSGGSTLTMQLARLVEGAPTHDIAAKLRQIVHAEALEHELSKDQILTLYLNLAPYGGNIEGVRAASLAYFGKEPARLTIAEAALLVALPQSPEARRPDRDPRAAEAGRNLVLDRMVSEGVISPEAAAAAKRVPVPTARRDFPMLAAHLGDEAIASRPHAREIEVTVDKRLQAALERLAAARAPTINPEASVAIVVADEQSGDILASVGSSDYLGQQNDGFVDMTQAVRSPGSTLKPLIYGLSYELGLAHPQSLIEDRPTSFQGYVPANFDGMSHGTVTIHDALTQSLNVPAVVVLDAVGVARLVSRLRRANANPVLPDETAAGLAIGLGGVGVTLRDLVSIYAAIARGGSPVHLKDGVTMPAADTAPAAPVLDPVAAWYVTDILRDVPPPLNGSPGRVAYKTGTSYGYRDAWAIGYDGRTVIGVWVGRPDGAPVPGIAGITAAAPVLFEAFDRLAEPAAPFRSAPPGVIFASNTELPAPLRRFRHPDDAIVARDAAPQIAFPADGVDVDLGVAGGDAAPLIVKIRNGVPPFTFFANGAPIGQSAFARQERWRPDGPGYVTLSVVDAKGRSDRVKVFID